MAVNNASVSTSPVPAFNAVRLNDTQGLIERLSEGAPEFEKPREFAQRVGVCARHVERMAAAGKIPALRIGKSIRIPVRPALEAMAAAATAGAKGEPGARGASGDAE
jgi:excisionase family DNA binding protein